jgi:hypothetical protein
VQALRHTVPLTHCPADEQVWIVFPSAAHCALPGLQTPQTPEPLHTPLGVCVQAVPDAVGVSVGVEPLQLGVLQPPVGSAGVLVLSFVAVTPPLASQTCFWQSPGTCALGGATPCVADTKPHMLWMQAETRHACVGTGQSLGNMHDMFSGIMSGGLAMSGAVGGVWPFFQQVLSSAQK